MRTLRIFMPAILALVAATSAAFATPITVDNFSFETLPGGGLNNSCAGTGCAYSSGLPIPGWTTTGSTGQFQPGSDPLYFTSIPDGITVAYTNGGTIAQTVSDTAVAGSVYELKVDLGFREDYADPGTITLQIGANTALAVGVPDQFSGNWVTYTALLTATALDDGAPITISLASEDIQGVFDNVRLNIVDNIVTTLVPEPLTLSLFGAGLAGMFFFSRRKLRQHA